MWLNREGSIGLRLVHWDHKGWCIHTGNGVLGPGMWKFWSLIHGAFRPGVGVFMYSGAFGLWCIMSIILAVLGFI